MYNGRATLLCPTSAISVEGIAGGVKVPEGQILDDMIRVLQEYYGNNIRGNSGNLEKMTGACWATFYHSFSTDAYPRHYCCPKGEDSFCKYQRAAAHGEDVPTHHIPTSSCTDQCPSCHTTIPADFEKYLEPQWRSLCTTELLEKCLLGATQIGMRASMLLCGLVSYV